MRAIRSKAGAYIIARVLGCTGCVAFLLGLYLAGGAADTILSWADMVRPFLIGVGTAFAGAVMVWVAEKITRRDKHEFI